MANIVTGVVLEGFQAAPGSPCPYLATSVNSDAWALGRHLNSTGRLMPTEVRKSRGDTYRVGDMLFSVKWRNGLPQIERLQ